MKVFMNKRQGDYTGGLLLVAANSAQEAHELCVNSEKMEDIYWEWFYGEIYDDVVHEQYKERVYNSYKWDGWEEIPNLWYAGVKPCIIAEEGHSE